jgi:hypothetical protein
MGELEFTRDDVRNLATKLNTPDLSNDERELLQAIFSAAAERVSPARPQDSADETELHHQLVNSFLRDSGDEFIIQCELRIRHRPGEGN